MIKDGEAGFVKERVVGNKRIKVRVKGYELGGVLFDSVAEANEYRPTKEIEVIEDEEIVTKTIYDGRGPKEVLEDVNEGGDA